MTIELVHYNRVKLIFPAEYLSKLSNSGSHLVHMVLSARFKRIGSIKAPFLYDYGADFHTQRGFTNFYDY